MTNSSYTYPEEKDADFIRNYFRFDDDLPSILREINKDDKINKAIERFYGMRIVRQDPWECLISYICATNANIPAIRDMVSNLAKKFGKKIIFDDRKFYTFPKPEILANATIDRLKDCKLGYRAKYVLEVSRKIHEDPKLLENFKNLSYENAKKKLLSINSLTEISDLKFKLFKITILLV